MKCVSALSTESDTESAWADVAGRVADGLSGQPADLAVVFISADHAGALETIGRDVRARGIARHVIGCTAESVVGEGREVEGSSALSLWAVSLPGVELATKRLTFDDGQLHGLSAEGTPADRPETLLVLGDPFTFPAEDVLKRLNETAPGLKIVGGMASASHVPRGNRLLVDDAVFQDGAVACSLTGPVALRTVVSQGCRPIGRPLVVTRAERNVIRELGGKPALEVLREIFDGLTPDDQERVRQGLHIGRVISEYQDAFRQGDFLIRNVLGTDDAGGIAVSDLIRAGRTVQFHVRDADSADEDLRGLLETERLARPTARVHGALLFSCNGRGTRLFPGPNHDVEALHRAFGAVPVAGFFAMGELGPVGGQNFVHGYTASIVLFEEAEGATA